SASLSPLRVARLRIAALRLRLIGAQSRLSSEEEDAALSLERNAAVRLAARLALRAKGKMRS
ncbi:hypothetical protein NL493_29325, partial [Klebsiella pneumoniae]|nr:hypothetical protein [Klebsiella pneumoniae]